jgi:hypothetical protein
MHWEKLAHLSPVRQINQHASLGVGDRQRYTWRQRRFGKIQRQPVKVESCGENSEKLSVLIVYWQREVQCAAACVSADNVFANGEVSRLNGTPEPCSAGDVSAWCRAAAPDSSFSADDP